MVYNYDAGGNITSKVQVVYTTGTLGTPTKTINYTYDSIWKDKLLKYNNGPVMTYDTIGNLTNDGTYNYNWEEGRQLQSMNGNGHTISYKYNDSGIRTQKTVDGVITNYHLVGNKVTYEDNGTDKIYYTYDSAGKLVSMNLNGVEYFYIKDAQGDIIGLIDGSGTQVVSYTYDTWGKLISIDGTLKDSVGVKNPYRYRGYRYDTETGLYYLQSRYYNPEWGRFINADVLIGQTGELLGHNLFAYCKNNPVNMSDSTGARIDFSGNGHDTGDDLAVSLAIQNHKYNYSTGTIRKMPSGSSSSAKANTTKSSTSSQKSANNKHGGTLGYGFSGSFEAGIRVAISVEVVTDTYNHVGLAITPSFGGGTFAWGLTGTYSKTNADSIYDLRGQGVDGGASANLGPIPASLGFDYTGTHGIDGFNVNVGGKIEFFHEEHTDATWTWIP